MVEDDENPLRGLLYAFVISALGFAVATALVFLFSIIH
jgi:hypothetical protein